MTPDADDEPAGLRDLCTQAVGGRVERVERIEAGLGTRHFHRVTLSGARVSQLIARVEQPEDEAIRPSGVPPEPPLEPIRRLYEDAGLPVPARLGGDAERGIELLEDAGPVSLLDQAPGCSAAERTALYAEACALVPRIQALRAEPDAVAAFGRRLDGALFRYKADQLIAYGLPFLRGRDTRPAEAEAVHAAFDDIEAAARTAPQRLAHRDFKAANLHLVQRDGVRRLMMIDLQGAFLAPPEYDLVCLLRDLQCPVPDDEVARHVATTRPTLPDAPDAETFALRFDLLTLSRVGKDLSRYVWAMQTRGDVRNQDRLPNAVRFLREAAARVGDASPRLARLAELLSADELSVDELSAEEEGT